MPGATRSTRAAALGVAVLVACSSSNEGPAQPPAAPTGLTATAGSGSVALAWDAASGATSYSVYRGTSTGALASKTRIATPAVTSFEDATVSDGTEYFYQVTASNAGGESAGSSEASATPSAALPPAPPTGVTASGGTNQVTVAWQPVAGATSYNLYWDTASPVTTASNEITGASSPYVHGSLAAGTTYRYAVTAVNGNGESGLSAEASATTLNTTTAPPPYIQARIMRWTVPSMPSGVPIQEVRICADPSCVVPVTGATVQVTYYGSYTLSWSAAEQQYVGNVMPSAGSPVTLTVTIPAGAAAAAGTYTATGTMYTTAPAVTAPTTGTTWSRFLNHDITWTAGAPAATTPGSVYAVAVNDSAGNFYPATSGDAPVEVPVDSTSFTLLESSLPAAGSYIAWVAIGTTGIATRTGGGIPISGAASGSGLYIGYASSYVAFTVTN